LASGSGATIPVNRTDSVMRVLSYNIRYGGTGREEAIASVIRSAGPDLVVLQEATNPTVVGRIAGMCGMTEWKARDGFSIGYMSRVPTRDSAWHHPRGSRHAFLEIVLASEARIFGLHLSAWFSKWSERRRAREIGLLLDGIQDHQHGPHIIAGDFNALAPGEILHVAKMPAWIRGMVWLSGRDIARDTIGVMIEKGYVDAWRSLHPGEPGYTFPTWDPHVRLDYIFVPPRDLCRVSSCEIVDGGTEARNASDHLPLVADVDFAVQSGEG
jgi:endonuclease/exonuclease/phosphatase family metal-dependent hydrolase